MRKYCFIDIYTRVDEGQDERNSPSIFHGFLRVFHLKYTSVWRKLRGGQVILEQK